MELLKFKINKYSKFKLANCFIFVFNVYLSLLITLNYLKY